MKYLLIVVTCVCAAAVVFADSCIVSGTTARSALHSAVSSSTDGNTLLAASSVPLTAGWRNNGESKYTIPKPSKLLWKAPFDKGMEGFSVSWREGGAGTVRIVESHFGKGLEINKTNDIGYVSITPKETFELPPNTRPKAFAAVMSYSENFEFARGVLKVGAAGMERQVPSDGAGLAVGGARRMTWMPNTAPSAYEGKYAFGDPVKDGVQQSTSIMVSGAASRSVWCAWRVDDADAAIAAAKEDPVRKPFIASRAHNKDMIPLADFERKIASDTEHSAKVLMKDGYPRFFIDGVEAPPILYKGMGCENGIVRFAGANLAKSVPLMVVKVDFRGVPPRKGLWHEGGFDVDVAVEELRKAMRCAPDSMFVLATGLGAYPTFTARYPDETWQTEDGRHVCGNFNLANKTVAPGETPPKGYWPWVSYHSLVWRNQVKANLSTLIAALQKAGLSKRIVGVHLYGFHDGQFALAKADYSRPAIDAFRRWTGRVDAVPPLTLDKPMLDPVNDAKQVEWLRFQKRAPFAMLEDLARHIKKSFAKDIIVFRWCMLQLGGGMTASWDITPFAESDAFDVIIPQPDYRRRAPALPHGVGMPFTSINRYGKRFFFEFDLRTWGVWTARETEMRDAGASRARDPQEWRTIHRKMAGQMLARRCGFWYYDMENGWFRPSEVAEDIADVASFARALASRKTSTWRPQTAFVIDEESLFRLNLFKYSGDDNYETSVTAASGRANMFTRFLGQLMRLAASGVPFDVYLAKDFDSDPALAATYRYVVRRISDSDKYIMPDEFNSKARAAGAYVPVEPNVLEVDMNGDFISVHALRNGTFDFKLPFPCKVRNVKSGQYENMNGDVFKIAVEAGQTCWFTLEEEAK